MTVNAVDEEIYICSFCGLASTSDEVEFLVQAIESQKTLICSNCIRECEVLVEKEKREDINFFRIPGALHSKPLGKLRPVTKIPKHWIICQEDLLSSTPNVTACSPDGKEHGVFSLPKQLARWMITAGKKMEIDQVRDEIKKDLTATLREVLRNY